LERRIMREASRLWRPGMLLCYGENGVAIISYARASWGAAVLRPYNFEMNLAMVSRVRLG
jgi:hypothetical protein